QVAHDADVASVAEAARSPERTAKRVLDREAERQEQGPRTVVSTRRVVLVVDHRAENDLRHVVPTRRELIEHEMLARRRRLVLVGELFGVVERARDEDVVGDLSPVETLGDCYGAGAAGS